MAKRHDARSAVGSGGKKHFQKKGGVAKAPKKHQKSVSMKNQIRAVERLLKKTDLDTKVRRVEEAKLESLRQAQVDLKQSQKEQKLAVRYHMVRFFERVKIQRSIKQLQQSLQRTGGKQASEEEAKKLAQLQEDLKYVLHFPKGEKYVSLLRQADTPEAQADLEAKRQHLRGLVRQRLAEDALINEANEGRPQQPEVVESHRKRPEKVVQEVATVKPPHQGMQVSAVGRKQDVRRPKPSSEAKQQPPVPAPDLATEDDFFLAVDEEGASPGINPAAQIDASSGTPLSQTPEAASGKGKRQQERTGNSHGSSGMKWDASRRGQGQPLHKERHGKRSWPVTSKPVSARQKQTAVESQAAEVKKLPLRTRAEGGRKRRK